MFYQSTLIKKSPTINSFLPWPDLFEKDERIVYNKDSTALEVELPGIPKDDIKISSRDRNGYQELKIAWKTRDGSNLDKTFHLIDHNIEEIDAKYKDGLLRIKVPKLRSKARDVQIK